MLFVLRVVWMISLLRVTVLADCGKLFEESDETVELNTTIPSRTELDISIPFNGTCYGTGREYKPPMCETWDVNVVLALRSNTTLPVLWQIDSLIDYSVKNCDYRSSLTLYMPGQDGGTCGVQGAVGSQEHEALLHPVNLAYASINTTDHGVKILNMFDELLRCVNHSTYTRGGAVFFITNVPCTSMCDQLFAVIEKEADITDALNALGYVFRVVYFDDTNNMQMNPACQVKELFTYCNTYADVFQVKNDWLVYAKRLYTCPSKPTISEGTAALLMETLIPLGVLLIAATVVGLIYWRRRRMAYSKEPFTNALSPALINAIRSMSFINAVSTPKRQQRPSVQLSYHTVSNCGFNHCNRIYFDVPRDKVRVLARMDEWEIAEESLFVNENEILGKGAFAVCYRGTIKGTLPVNRVFKNLNLAIESIGNTSNEVAVKTLPTYTDEVTRADFFNEIDFMKTLGYHPHIVSLIGCVSNAFAPKIVTELCAKGDLLRFLRSNKCNFVVNRDDRSDDEGSPLYLKDLISIAWQVCDGMCYLSSQNLIHRDVAARNVLITGNLVAKVGDFGLCRYLDQALYTSRGGRLPIKWMAIESLKLYEYSTKSDVWSYGVLLFELFSLGDGPFPSVQPEDMITHLEEGNRNERPRFCSDQIYSLMNRCWEEDPELRPTFAAINTFFYEMLQVDDAANDYLDLVDDTNDGYLNPRSMVRRPDSRATQQSSSSWSCSKV